MKLETIPEDGAPPKNYVEIIKYIENTLGWTWPWEDTRPPWKIRAAEAGRLKKAAKKGVRGHRPVTINDLKDTIDWMRSQRIVVESPIGVMYYVERALKEWRDRPGPATSLEDALAEVRASPLPDTEKERWARKMRRAGDGALDSVVAEWRAGER